MAQLSGEFTYSPQQILTKNISIDSFKCFEAKIMVKVWQVSWNIQKCFAIYDLPRLCVIVLNLIGDFRWIQTYGIMWRMENKSLPTSSPDGWQM